MKTIKIIGWIACLFFGLTGCNDWLNLYPDNAQTSDQYWNTKQDVEAVVAAGYIKMRDNANLQNMLVWGEARGNGLTFYKINTDIYKLRNLDILPTNEFTNWSSMYAIINMANSVLRYAPDVMAKDPSFTSGEMNSYFSEAYFQRALAYFYLVRTFRDVPYITEPYVKDNGNYAVPKTTQKEILEYLVTDLTNALDAAKEFFPETDAMNPVNTKGRATKWSIYALLADIYLWQGNYQECLDACNQIINSGRIGLIEKEFWFTNFFPGNSNESVFELQFDYTRNQQTNGLLGWFYQPNYMDAAYGPSQKTFFLFLETSVKKDVRGSGNTYWNNYLWKYVGIQTDLTGGYKRSTTDQIDQNFILYRLADVYLMKAEALIMQGQGNYQEAMDIIGQIRTRAGIEEAPLVALGSELEMLKFLLNERGRELCGEGKNWFDLLRVCSRNNYQYKDYLIEEVLTMISSNQYGIVRSKLADPESYYLPINQTELNSNEALEQSNYYKSLGY